MFWGMGTGQMKIKASDMMCFTCNRKASERFGGLVLCKGCRVMWAIIRLRNKDVHWFDVYLAVRGYERKKDEE
jgi:hypothetical protein